MGFYDEDGSFNDGQTVPWSAIQSKSLLKRKGDYVMTQS
jgi:hypothetical protein